MKNKPLFICLSLIFMMSINNSFAQQEPMELNTITGAYQRIIHLNPEDYNLDIASGEGNPGSGIEGIHAGDRYLIIWDLVAFYVYDISTYMKLTTIVPEFAVRDIVESQGKIYCLSKNDHITVYNSFESFDDYQLSTQFQSVPEYKSDLAKHKLPTFPDPAKIKRRSIIMEGLTEEQKKANKKLANQIKKQRENLEYYAAMGGEPVWSGAFVQSLHVADDRVYVNVDFNYLDFERDFISEVDDIITMKDNHHFMVLKNRLRENDYYALIDNHYIDWKTKYKDEFTTIAITIMNMEYSNINKNIYMIKNDQQNGKLVTTLGVAYQNDRFITTGYWLYYDNNQYSGISVLCLNIDKNEIVNIKLPDWPTTLPFVTNSIKYYTYKNSYFYAVAYNKDLSVDIVKVEVNLP